MSKLSAALLMGTSIFGGVSHTAEADTVSGTVIARGTVYLDRNDNGMRDAGEPGLAGIRVSNGVDIVSTDAEGRYEIEINAADAIVFVLKPRGYRTAIDDLNIPRFYYIHRPNGAPVEGFRYRGVAPTGDLPASIDFPLYEQKEPDQFKVLLISDPQPYTMQEVAWYGQTVMRELSQTDAAFAITLGDIVGDNLDLFDPITQIHAQASMPFYYLPGNHDLNYFAPDNRNATNTFERMYGPPYYAFQYGSVHFIVLHNMYWDGHNGLLPSGHPRYDRFRDNLTHEQLMFVRNYLADVPQDERIVLAMHAPLLYVNRRIGTPQTRQLMEILSSHPHTVSFAGHSHLNLTHVIGEELGYTPTNGNKHLLYNFGSISGNVYRGPLDGQGVPISVMWDGSPRGYVVANFDSADMSYRYKAVERPDDYQMIIHVPDFVAQPDLASTEVQVNVFSGSEGTHVRMRVRGHGDWIEMQQDSRTDPAYERLKERVVAEAAGVLYRRHDIQQPFRTDHHWVATLPVGLGEGIHTIEVEVTDYFGQTWRDMRPILVVDDLKRIEELDYHNIRVPVRDGLTQ